MRELRTEDGLLVGAVDLSDDYSITPKLYNKWQSDRVPFYTIITGFNTERGLLFEIQSEEIFYDYKSSVTKATLIGLPQAIKDSFRSYEEPEVYIQNWAESLVDPPLTPLGISAMPSRNAAMQKMRYEEMMNFYNTYMQCESSAGASQSLGNTMMKSVMMKFKGEFRGEPKFFYCGLDLKGVEYYLTMNAAFSNIGGFIGKMFGKDSSKEDTTRFGHGKPCDCIEWGAECMFLGIVDPDKDREGFEDFIRLVSSYQMAPDLKQRFYQLRNDKMIENYQISMQYKRMAIQAQQNLQANQQRLQQTLRDNAAAMSAGIMDSWNQKMASDSRISQNYSEAIRGVNVYQNTYGQNVDVSVTADHVYQNQYGDVYGVSGGAIDQDILNSINWTELKK